MKGVKVTKKTGFITFIALKNGYEMKKSFRPRALFLSIVLLGFLASHGQPPPGQGMPQGAGRKFNRDFSKTKAVNATLTTHEGVLTFELFFKDAPNTVAGFMHLADSGFYKGLTFHRIIQGFMAQAGDPNGDGTGGAGYTLDEEIGKRKHEAGTLSMANAGPNTGSSQFFVCHMPQTHLDGKHTIFGRLTSGFDALTRLEIGDPILDLKIEEVRK